MRTLAFMAWLLITPLACDVSLAATIYRCGTVGNEYSQTPCPDGQRLKVDDSRTPEQHMQARVLATHTRDLGLALERDRLAKEAAFRPPRAGNLSSSVTPQTVEKPARAKVHKLKKKRSAHAPATVPAVLRTDRTQPGAR
jgi:hypothetical protein